MKRSIFIQAFILASILIVSGCSGSQQETTQPTIPPTQTAAPEPSISTTNIPEPRKTELPLIIETGTLEFDGLKRTYLVFIPDKYTDSKEYPLVIYLHSYGWNAQKGMDYTQLNQVGNANGFFILYPNAFMNWNSGISDSSSWTTPDLDDVGYINALIDVIGEQYNIDQEMVYAAGYSNGGFMAYKLACHLGHRIAAIASVSGVISASVKSSCNPIRPVPVIHIHGTKDSWVPDTGVPGWQTVEQTLAYWIDINNCENSKTSALPDLDSTDGSTVEQTIYTNCADNSNVVYYKVINGGHTWPGAGPTGYSAGNTNQDFNASEEIWNFFKNYRLNLEN